MNLTNLDYIELKKKLEASGLLEYTHFYYFLNFLSNILLLAVFFAAIFYFDNWYATLLFSFPVSLYACSLPILVTMQGTGQYQKICS